MNGHDIVGCLNNFSISETTCANELKFTDVIESNERMMCSKFHVDSSIRF